MRWLTPVLLALVVAIQWPLWFGKGSWFRVWQVEKQFAEQQTIDQNKIARNRALFAEVEDLKTGNTAVEERARYELGMVRNGEVFFQILETSSTPRAADTVTTLTTPDIAKP